MSISSSDVLQIPYQRTVRNAISDAFDIYLAILRAVRKRVNGALGRESPDWRVCNSCPACCYKVSHRAIIRLTENTDHIEIARGRTRAALLPLILHGREQLSQAYASARGSQGR